MTQVVNIAAALPRMAAEIPYSPAIFYPCGRGADGKVRYTHYTYKQLDEQSALIARGLTEVGIGRGVRTALMVKPSLEFFALTFGIFKAGAVPVMIDPGIGLKSLKACLAESEPEAFIGVSEAHAFRTLFSRSFSKVRHLVTVGRRWWWGGATLDGLLARKH